MSAAKGKSPPLILFIRLLRMVRRLALRGMMRMKMKVKLPTLAIYALSGLRRWVCDEIFCSLFSVPHAGKITCHGGASSVFVCRRDRVGGGDACNASPRGRLTLIL